MKKPVNYLKMALAQMIFSITGTSGTLHISNVEITSTYWIISNAEYLNITKLVLASRKASLIPEIASLFEFADGDNSCYLRLADLERVNRRRFTFELNVPTSCPKYLIAKYNGETLNIYARDCYREGDILLYECPESKFAEDILKSLIVAAISDTKYTARDQHPCKILCARENIEYCVQIIRNTLHSTYSGLISS